MDSLSTNNLKELRELLAFAFELQDAIRKTLEDRRITIIDIRHFIPLIFVVKPALEDLGNPLDRYKALTDGEKLELWAYAKTRFNLGDEDINALIEETITEIAGDIRVAKRWLSFRRKSAA